MTKDKFSDLQMRLTSISTDLGEMESAEDQRMKKDAELARMMMRLVGEFATRRRIPLPDDLKDKLHLYLQTSIQLADFERELGGLEALGTKR